MVVKFKGDYTKKETIINALKEYNTHLKNNYAEDIAIENQYHFDEYYLNDKQLNKIYVEYNNKKHYVTKIHIDVLHDTLQVSTEI